MTLGDPWCLVTLGGSARSHTLRVPKVGLGIDDSILTCEVNDWPTVPGTKNDGLFHGKSHLSKWMICWGYPKFQKDPYKVVPQFGIAKLVPITPMSLWFMLDITIVFMGFINQRSHHWGAPSCSQRPSSIFRTGEVRVSHVTLLGDHGETFQCGAETL